MWSIKVVLKANVYSVAVVVVVNVIVLRLILLWSINAHLRLPKAIFEFVWGGQVRCEK